jgi:beta-aspartyl-peptidase (threonine type)
MSATFVKSFRYAIAALVIAPITASAPVRAEEEKPMAKYALAIHGGAGTIKRETMSAKLEKAYKSKLLEALKAGEAVLADGGTGLDAIIAAIILMEDSPLFNAGKGAVFTNAGTNELDASIMDGKTLQAGAVAGSKRVKNPILLARAVMDISPHVMLQGGGADTFAEENGLEMVDQDYFYTERRWQQHERLRGKDKTSSLLDPLFGTVGAVALDMHGNLAAATSTGGTTNKRWGRIGDSPIIGAGTYADNRSCAVSGTGDGEYFIRATVARSVCAKMEYQGLSLAEAAKSIIMGQLVEMGGEGGIIALDKAGNVALVFNSAGMYRGSVRSGEEPEIAIYKD